MTHKKNPKSTNLFVGLALHTLIYCNALNYFFFFFKSSIVFYFPVFTTNDLL